LLQTEERNGPPGRAKCAEEYSIFDIVCINYDNLIIGAS